MVVGVDQKDQDIIIINLRFLYIAINARPGKYRGGGYIDYCCKCFAELKNKESEKAKEIVAKDLADGMTSDMINYINLYYSLFTRVLFNYGGYTAF